MLVPVRTTHPRLVGTAFDYALRLELQRRLGNISDTRDWVAESALRRIEWFMIVYGPRPPRWLTRDAARAREVVGQARKFQRRYQRLKHPRRAAQQELAAHSLRLAKLDGFIRAGYLNTDIRIAAQRDVKEVARLLEIAPLNELAGATPLLLNPTFGYFSTLVGGADADIISGGRLIDIKTTKNPAVERHMVRQLVGYMILARCMRRRNTAMPRLTTVEIYFSRFGHSRALEE